MSLIGSNFKGAAKRIDDMDLPKLGHMLGVGEDEIHAFIDAETLGSGFDRTGRPKMLFEPHIFYRELGPGSKRDQAIRLGLAYRKQGEKPYPADSYPRLKKAMEIDEVAALRSASWGLGQVMGFNHEAAGFSTVEEMVRAMMEDEENHLLASVNFILENRLDDELREHNWAAFARGYNGPAYRKNAYDVKLRRAFEKWSRIKDTPWSPDMIDPPFLPPAPAPAPTDPDPAPSPAPAPVPSAGGGAKSGLASILAILAAIGAAIVEYFSNGG